LRPAPLLAEARCDVLNVFPNEPCVYLATNPPTNG
jgi:hypothetical protein